MKTCTRCQLEKPLTEFSRDSHSKNGIRAQCKACCKAGDKRRNPPPAVHPGIAAEAPLTLEDVVRRQGITRDLPPLLRSLEGNPEFEQLMAQQGQGKPLPPPKGVRGPVQVIDTRRHDRLWTIVVITDIHVPDQDKGFWRALLQFIAETQPDEIIIMGDFLELESCSQHKGANLIQLTHDFDAGNAALDEIHAAAPKAKIVYLEGNHETRLNRFIAERAPTLMGTLSVPAGLRLKERGIEWVPEDQQPIARGDIDILHGHQLGKMLPKHHAMRAVEVYGRPGRTVTYGHTHKPQTFTRPSVGGSIRGVGLGCGRTLKPGWLHGSEAGWEHEFGVIHLRPDQTSNYYQVKVSNGKFAWNGKLFGDA